MLSEQEVIKLLKKELKLPDSWEDADRFGKGRVLTTDSLCDGDDFPRGMSAHAKGWMSACAQLSDLAACNAIPDALSFSWMIPAGLSSTEIRQIASGIRDCAFYCNAPLVGGDVNGGDKLVLTGCAVGHSQHLISRRGAMPGDVLAVTGLLGASAAGYLILKQDIRVQGGGKLVKLFSYPIPRLKQMHTISRLVHSATDLSDGLVIGAYNLAIGCGVELDESLIPYARGIERVGERVGKTRFELASIGCDYELLLSIPRKKFSEAKKLVEKTGCSLTEIGVFTKQKKVVLKTSGGGKKFLPRSGFQHAF